MALKHLNPQVVITGHQNWSSQEKKPRIGEIIVAPHPALLEIPQSAGVPATTQVFTAIKHLIPWTWYDLIPFTPQLA